MLGSEVRGEVGEGKCQSREQKPWKIKSYEFLYYFRYVSWHLSRKSPNGMTLQIMTESDVIWPKWCPVWSASTSGVHSGINGGGHFTLADLTAYTCGPGVSLAKSAFPWRWEGDPGACPPGNIFNQEINLVQSILSRAPKNDVLTRLLEIPTFFFSRDERESPWNVTSLLPEISEIAENWHPWWTQSSSIHMRSHDRVTRHKSS